MKWSLDISLDLNVSGILVYSAAAFSKLPFMASLR